MDKQKNSGALVGAVLTAVLLVGCAQTNVAPVETRGGFGQGIPRVDPATLPGAENAGKPGYYTVKPGDTLIRIGLEHGQSWKDIALWSKLENPNVIEVGQVVRVVPPGMAAGEAVAISRPSSGVTSSSVQGTALPPAGSSPGPAVPAAPAATKPSTPPASASTSGTAEADASGLGFIWPASGAVLAGFHEQNNKGVDIGGQEGDPIIAAAAGKVIHAGEVYGYGHLVIVQHNSTYLTAYAHNKKLLVKEDQQVKKGQKIAEMGNTDADRVKLHFELRRQGKPLDPLRYLPKK